MQSLTKLGKTLITGLIGATFMTSAFAADITLKLGHLANETNTWHKAVVKFGEELSTLTKGRIEVQIFPNSSLGKEMDLINGMQLLSPDPSIFFLPGRWSS